MVYILFYSGIFIQTCGGGGVSCDGGDSGGGGVSCDGGDSGGGGEGGWCGGCCCSVIVLSSDHVSCTCKGTLSMYSLILSSPVLYSVPSIALGSSRLTDKNIG